LFIEILLCALCCHLSLLVVVMVLYGSNVFHNWNCFLSFWKSESNMWSIMLCVVSFIFQQTMHFWKTERKKWQKKPLFCSCVIVSILTPCVKYCVFMYFYSFLWWNFCKLLLYFVFNSHGKLQPEKEKEKLKVRTLTLFWWRA
jgi:hypothetical protein